MDAETKEIRLYGDAREPTVKLCDVPVELLQMTISGYEVIKCWLKFHSYAYTRTQFTNINYLELLGLLSKLSKQVELIGEIDTVIDRIVTGDLALL